MTVPSPTATDDVPTPPRGGRASRRPRRGLVLGLAGGAVALLLVVVAVVVLVRGTGEDVLDARAVEQGVSGVVTADWKRTIVDARCPEDQPVRAGTAFACTATVDGRPQQVPVRVVDETGTYEVGQPR